MSIYIKSWKSPVGELILGDYEGKLCLADWKYRKLRTSVDKRIQSFFDSDYIEKETELHLRAIGEFKKYFKEDLQMFNIPLALAGSEFQISVWQELKRIPYGKTESYLGLSKKLNNEKAIRAVASANGANAISIIIPCHRVIGSDGSLTGYAGGLSAKKKLLKLEHANILAQMSLF